MSFLVLWLSAIAVALQVLLWMLEIIGITAGRQSCGQVPEPPSVTKGMNGKISFFGTFILKPMQKEGYVNSENPSATEVEFGFLGW